MTTEHLQRVHELFDAALQQPPQRRATYLAAACGSDDALRQEVEALLQHDSAAGDDFLRPPDLSSAVLASAVAAAEQPDPMIGRRIGRYHVKGVIARGGMATVYEAVQEQPHRVVALKLMHRNVPSRSALRRFGFEAQVLGRLRHPNVAQIYEAGLHVDESGSVPYFAMEYIPGARTITAYAAEKQLDTRQRLEFFLPVCDAVQHGHQKGIIHRDLKPANILVGADGVPKLIDFGVARGTDSDMVLTSQQTNIGQLVGTLQYMSPEQCDGDPYEVDSRSDVYSLGVVLYELLTGVVPYDATKSTIYQATRVVKEAQPPRPSTVVGERQKGVRNLLPRSGPAGAGHKRFLTPFFARQLRGDLDTIVLKALEKNQDRRYASAADLAQDIRRHLHGDLIEARPPTAWSRAVRWTLRHPVWVTAAACVALVAMTILATTVAVYWLNLRPYQMVRSRDRSEARLLAFNGNLVRPWNGRTNESVRFADLVTRPPALGGGRLAIVGFSQEASSRFPAQLCAYDADSKSEEPAWQAGIESEQIPVLLQEHRYGPRDFGVSLGQVADVFDDPDLPGQELIVVHKLSIYTHSAIRVYDLKGQVRYQVWVDAQVEGMYWLERPGVLVIAGINGKAPWEDRGHFGAEHNHPLVVFAIRPQLDFKTLGYLAQESDEQEAADERLRPLWYKCVLPPDTAPVLTGGVALSPVTDTLLNDGNHVRVELSVRAAYPPSGSQWAIAVSWVLNATTGEPAGEPEWTDWYRRNQALLDGDPNKLPVVDWHLGPLPPIEKRSRE